jgi:hypothetical protein
VSLFTFFSRKCLVRISALGVISLVMNKFYVEHEKRCGISPPAKFSCSEINGNCSASITTKRAVKAHVDSQYKNLTFVCAVLIEHIANA